MFLTWQSYGSTKSETNLYSSWEYCAWSGVASVSLLFVLWRHVTANIDCCHQWGCHGGSANSYIRYLSHPAVVGTSHTDRAVHHASSRRTNVLHCEVPRVWIHREQVRKCTNSSTQSRPEGGETGGSICPRAPLSRGPWPTAFLYPIFIII